MGHANPIYGSPKNLAGIAIDISTEGLLSYVSISLREQDPTQVLTMLANQAYPKPRSWE